MKVRVVAGTSSPPEALRAVGLVPTSGRAQPTIRTRADALHLQRLAGNAAVVSTLADAQALPVQRGCACGGGKDGDGDCKCG